MNGVQPMSREKPHAFHPVDSYCYFSGCMGSEKHKNILENWREKCGDDSRVAYSKGAALAISYYYKEPLSFNFSEENTVEQLLVNVCEKLQVLSYFNHQIEEVDDFKKGFISVVRLLNSEEEFGGGGGGSKAPVVFDINTYLSIENKISNKIYQEWFGWITNAMKSEEKESFKETRWQGAIFALNYFVKNPDEFDFKNNSQLEKVYNDLYSKFNIESYCLNKGMRQNDFKDDFISVIKFSAIAMRRMSAPETLYDQRNTPADKTEDEIIRRRFLISIGLDAKTPRTMKPEELAVIVAKKYFNTLTKDQKGLEIDDLPGVLTKYDVPGYLLTVDKTINNGKNYYDNTYLFFECFENELKVLLSNKITDVEDVLREMKEFDQKVKLPKIKKKAKKPRAKEVLVVEVTPQVQVIATRAAVLQKEEPVAQVVETRKTRVKLDKFVAKFLKVITDLKTQSNVEAIPSVSDLESKLSKLEVRYKRSEEILLEAEIEEGSKLHANRDVLRKAFETCRDALRNYTEEKEGQILQMRGEKASEITSEDVNRHIRDLMISENISLEEAERRIFLSIGARRRRENSAFKKYLEQKRLVS